MVLSLENTGSGRWGGLHEAVWETLHTLKHFSHSVSLWFSIKFEIFFLFLSGTFMHASSCPRLPALVAISLVRGIEQPLSPFPHPSFHPEGSHRRETRTHGFCQQHSLVVLHLAPLRTPIAPPPTPPSVIEVS